MSALAKCLNDMGETVIGSDTCEHYFTEESLYNNKIQILKFNSENIRKYNDYIYIIGYTYDEYNNEEVKEIIETNKQYYYYSDFINSYFKKMKIGISGTHGKTTTTTMISKFFEDDKISYIIGDGNGKGRKDYNYFIFEACEYKYHFINYDYDYLIINNIDYDHPDYYNNIEEVIRAFQNVSKKAKHIIVNNDDINSKKIKHNNKYTFGINNKSCVKGEIVEENSNGYKFKINVKSNEYIFDLPFYGEHMLYNFLASFTIFYLLHYKNKDIENTIKEKVSKYKNPKRRKEEKKMKNGNIIIDDYAHHPKEIQATYESIKQKYPNYEITIVFQPHTYSRSIFLYKEFLDVFKDKNVYIMDTFISREAYDKCKESVINNIFINQKRYDENKIKSILLMKKQIIVFMGAGNIYNEVKKVSN